MCPILAGFSPQADAEVVGASDAATVPGSGCGGWVHAAQAPQAYGFMRRWTQADRDRAFVDDRESTTVLEADALFELLSRHRAMLAGKRVRVQVDNASLVWGVQGLYSAKPAVMKAIERIASICCIEHIILRICFVSGSAFNRIADCCSHMDALQAQALCQADLHVPLLFPR